MRLRREREHGGAGNGSADRMSRSCAAKYVPPDYPAPAERRQIEGRVELAAHGQHRGQGHGRRGEEREAARHLSRKRRSPPHRSGSISPPRSTANRSRRARWSRSTSVSSELSANCARRARALRHAISASGLSCADLYARTSALKLSATPCISVDGRVVLLDVDVLLLLRERLRQILHGIVDAGDVCLHLA